jgi:hypothetical protein
MDSIKVHQYNIDGTYIRQYNNVSEAAYFNGTTHTKILNALKRKSKYCNGFLWSTEFELSLPPYIGIRKKVYQYDFGDNFIKEWDSVHEAAEYFNVVPNSIRQAIRKNTGCCGYLWSYNKK